jgi:16S rRNA (uracil1498-N3)-methyltransferase
MVPGVDLQNSTVEIGEPDYHHLIRVLRMRVGDPLVILDNQGGAAHAEISAIGKRSLIARLGCAAKIAPEPPIHITVAQALGKGDKFEQVIAHGTEIGASAFIPLVTERAIVRLTPKEAETKRMRWHLVAKGAVEQAGRIRIPPIASLQSLTELACRCKEFAQVLVLHPHGSPLACILDAQKTGQAEEEKGSRGNDSLYSPSSRIPLSPLLLVIGPEGGLSPKETELMRDAGAHLVSLGPYTLRTETAALVAVSQILYHNALMRPMGYPSSTG